MRVALGTLEAIRFPDTKDIQGEVVLNLGQLLLYINSAKSTLVNAIKLETKYREVTDVHPKRSRRRATAVLRVDSERGREGAGRPPPYKPTQHDLDVMKEKLAGFLDQDAESNKYVDCADCLKHFAPTAAHVIHEVGHCPWKSSGIEELDVEVKIEKSTEGSLVGKA
jgi:hypothetical protein